MKARNLKEAAIELAYWKFDAQRLRSRVDGKDWQTTTERDAYKDSLRNALCVILEQDDLNERCEALTHALGRAIEMLNLRYEENPTRRENDQLSIDDWTELVDNR